MPRGGRFPEASRHSHFRIGLEGELSAWWMKYRGETPSKQNGNWNSRERIALHDVRSPFSHKCFQRQVEGRGIPLGK